MRVQNGYCADFERSSQPVVLLLAARGPPRKQWHLNLGAQQLLLESVRRKVPAAAHGGLTSAKRLWVGSAGQTWVCSQCNTEPWHQRRRRCSRSLAAAPQRRAAAGTAAGALSVVQGKMCEPKGRRGRDLRSEISCCRTMPGALCQVAALHSKCCFSHGATAAPMDALAPLSDDILSGGVQRLRQVGRAAREARKHQ